MYVMFTNDLPHPQATGGFSSFTTFRESQVTSIRKIRENDCFDWKAISPPATRLIDSLMDIDERSRVTAREALMADWFNPRKDDLEALYKKFNDLWKAVEGRVHPERWQESGGWSLGDKFIQQLNQPYADTEPGLIQCYTQDGEASYLALSSDADEEEEVVDVVSDSPAGEHEIQTGYEVVDLTSSPGSSRSGTPSGNDSANKVVLYGRERSVEL